MASSRIPNHYARLGLAANSYPSADRIRGAYLEQARGIHNAYDILSDPLRRAEYDAQVIAESYRRNMPRDYYSVAHEINVVRDSERAGLGSAQVADFLGLAALEGLRKHQDPAFQDKVDGQCVNTGRGLLYMRQKQPVSLADAERAIGDSLWRWDQIRAAFVTEVVARLRPHQLLPDHPAMRAAYRIMVSLGYTWESIRKTDAGAHGRWPKRNDQLLLGTIKANHDTLKDMTRVMRRLIDLARELDSLPDGDVRRETGLNYMCGAMNNWPGM